jgi:hypothetical protein
MDDKGLPEIHSMQAPPVYWGRINGWSVVATCATGVVMLISGVIAGSLWFGDLNNKMGTIVTKSELAEKLTPIEGQLAEQERFRDIRTSSTDKSLDDLRTIVAPVAGTIFRVSQLETGVIELRSQSDAKDKATNERIDRLVTSMSAKLDKVVEQQSEQNVSVKVLSSQLDDLRQRLDDDADRGRAKPMKLVWKLGLTHPDRPTDPPAQALSFP